MVVAVMSSRDVASCRRFMTQTFGKELGMTIRRRRDERGWSQAELLRRAFSPKSQEGSVDQISKLERGERGNPRAKTYMPYCRALEIDALEIERIRKAAAGVKERGGNWPKLKVETFPSNMSIWGYRHEEMGGALMSRVRAAYSNREDELRLYRGRGEGVYSRTLNDFVLMSSLGRHGIPVELLPKYLAYDVDSTRDCELISFVRHEKEAGGAKIFNSGKIRLCSTPPTRGGRSVYISETDYCSSLITDQLAFQRVYLDGPEKENIHDGYSGFLDSDSGLLHSIENANRMSNQIGASTIAFSRDGTLLLVQQSRKNSQSVGLIAPSGSGSLDWEDVGRKKKLLSIVEGGAARELVEECGLDILDGAGDYRIPSEVVADHYLRTYAFSRMLHRGGKPEFYCIAVLPFDAFVIQKARLSEEEKEYTERTDRAQQIILNFDEPENIIRDEMIAICENMLGPHDPVRIMGDNFIDFLSFPLRHGLELLLEALKGKHSGDLVKFLKEAFNRPCPEIVDM